MKKRSLTCWIAFICVLSSISISAQNKNQFLVAAEKSFMEKDYYSSLAYNLELIQFDTTDIHVMYKIAESARRFDSYNLAKEYYTKVVERDNDNKYPLASFYLGEMVQITGDYEAANKYYNMYLSEQEGEDEYLSARAKKELSSVEWAQEIIQNPYQNIEVNRLGDHINTEFSEFGAMIESEGITYSSLAFQTKDKRDIPTRLFSQILKSGDIAGISLDDDVNKDSLHTAHSTYNSNRSRFYYTICEYDNYSDIRCDLYSRAVLGDGSFGTESKLPDHINSDKHTTTQPSVGFDRDLGKEVLYFSTDRDGGEGKLDIWYVTIEGLDLYSEPVNISALNTAEDDITPFFHSNSQVLYFSSGGYTSLGGYDIFRSVKDGDTYGQVENVGAPINSSFNDVYYFLADDGKKALFSSNRTGAKYVDPINESCCYDIYEAEIKVLNIALNTITFDASTLDTLTDVLVQLIDTETGEIIDTRINKLSGDHPFTIQAGKEYLIISSKEGYTPDTITLNTNRSFQSEDIVRKVFLKRSTLDLIVYTFDDISKLALPGATTKLINLTDRTTQDIEITNGASNDFVFKLIPDHEYQIIAYKDRYTEVSTMFKAIDEEGTGVITRRLYLQRKDLNIYLPLALYFDNDEPDNKSMKLSTEINYTSTFDRYIFKKQEFKNEYTSSMSIADRMVGEQRIEDYFENDVKSGFDNFQSFLEAMLKQLDKGKTFELSIRGFASPRADTRYNLALSQRRVVSVENNIRQFANGAFETFIDNGQLKITQLSYGENLAPDNVSDVFYDRRNSIYSPEASKERRVEIVEIKTQLFNE